MESAAYGMLLGHSHQRAKSNNSTNSNQHKAKKPSMESYEDVLLKETKQQRSLSWLAPRKTKSLRRISAGAPPAPPVPMVPSTPTSTTSRGSYDSDGASQSSKAPSNMSSEATTVDFSEPALEEPLTPASCPPQRPQRPHEGLFEYTDDIERRAESFEYGESIMRPFSSHQDLAMEDQARHTDPRVMSPDVFQLMREADMAYEAVGVALKETKMAPAYSFAYAFDLSAPVAPAPIIPTRRQREKPGKPGKPSRAELPEIEMPRKGSTSTTASYESDKSRRSSHMTTKSESQHQARSSRWTLTENMAEAFKAQRIKAADRKPMTPSRIEAIWNGQDGDASAKRKEKEKEKKKKKAAPGSLKLVKSARNSVTQGGQTLRLEPFHNPNTLTSPIPMSTAEVRMRAIPFEIAIPPPPSSVILSPEIIHHDVSSQRPPSKLEQREEPELNVPEVQNDDTALDTAAIEVTEVTEIADVHLSPPPKNPARFRPRAPTMPQLPPIPEGLRAAGNRMSLKPPVVHRRSRSLNQAVEAKDESPQLTSTPFTLTNPGFRHGPIMLNDMGKEAEEPVEEDVDWAAFHSAILGGAGEDLEEFFPEEKPEGEDEECNIADEVAAWFEEFGFETHGELIASDLSSQRPDSSQPSQRDSAGSITSALSSPSTVHTDSDGELQTPVGSQHVFDTIRMLRDTCSASIYTVDTMDAPWEPTVVDGEAGEDSADEPAVMSAHAKPDMGHWAPHVWQWQADRPY